MSISQANGMLCRLPWVVKDRLMKIMDYRTSCVVRELSEEYRRLAARKEIPFSRVELYFKPKVVTIVLQFADDGTTTFIDYRLKGHGVHIEFDDGFEKTSKFKDYTGYIEEAIRDLFSYLEKPRVTIGTFFLHVDSAPDQNLCNRRFYKAFKSALCNLEHELMVDNLEMTFEGKQHQILPVIQALDANTLKSILLRGNGSVLPLSVTKIVDLPQWKQAEELKTENLTLNGSIKNFAHFVKVDTSLLRITPLQVVNFQKMLAKSTNFQLGTFSSSNSDMELVEAFLKTESFTNEIGTIRSNVDSNSVAFSSTKLN